MNEQSALFTEPAEDTDADSLAIDEADLYGIPEQFKPERFTPTTESEIEWVLVNIANARATAARIKQNSAERIGREVKREEFFLKAYTEPLRRWAKDHLPKRGSTVPLDNGKLSFVNANRRIKISEDDAATVALAERIAPDLIVVIPEQRKVNRLELAKRLQIVEKQSETSPTETYYLAVDPTTGEWIESEGYTITQPEERFSIKTN